MIIPSSYLGRIYTYMYSLESDLQRFDVTRLVGGVPDLSCRHSVYILYVQFEQEFTNMGSDWCLEQYEKCAEISIC